MLLKLKIFIYNLFFIRFKFGWLLHFNKLILHQKRNPYSIPIIIINFNQLFYLKKLVDFLLKRKFENIVIIDNLSTYPPLLDYYRSLKGVKVEYMDKNYGHMVFFENKELQEKYGKGFYVVTDADIVPNDNLPQNFLNLMLELLIKNIALVNKVGFALNIDDIPQSYYFKKEVLQWEEQFWKEKYKHSIESYHAKIDTTFAIYKPTYPTSFANNNFFSAIRMSGHFTAAHGGWYISENNLTDEQQFYRQTATNVSSWNKQNDGNLSARSKSFYPHN